MPDIEDLHPAQDELLKLMADDSAYKRATAKKGKQIGTIAVRPGRGPKRSLATASVEGPLSARAAAAAGLARIAIIYNGTVNGRPEWELQDEVRHADDELGCTLIAPKGYKFDLASIPRPLWSIIAPFEL